MLTAIKPASLDHLAFSPHLLSINYNCTHFCLNCYSEENVKVENNNDFEEL